MFPRGSLCIVSSLEGTLLTYMQHLCPILLEKGHPWWGYFKGRFMLLE